MKRFLMLVLSLVLSFGCLAIVACGGNANTEQGGEPSGDRVTYTINLIAETGKPVTGAFVRAYLDGNQRNMGVSNSNGVVELSLAPAEYTLSVDNLDPGYTVSQTYTTHAYSEEIDITVEVGVAQGTPAEGTVYQVGDVMYDFTLQEVESGEGITLSEVLSRYDVVMLNFCYESCVPCRQEFPLIIEAYGEYSDDIAIISIDPIDTEGTALAFKEEMGIPFYFCSDLGGDAVTDYFGFTGYPNNVIIDRYGIISVIDNRAVSSIDTLHGWFNSHIGEDYTPSY